MHLKVVNTFFIIVERVYKLKSFIRITVNKNSFSNSVERQHL